MMAYDCKTRPPSPLLVALCLLLSGIVLFGLALPDPLRGIWP